MRIGPYEDSLQTLMWGEARRLARAMSALTTKADMLGASIDVC